MSNPSPKSEFEEMIMINTIKYLKDKQKEMREKGYVPTLELLIEELEKKYGKV